MWEKGLYMRLDKYLCEMKLGTRSQVKNWIKQGFATVNGAVVRNPDYKINEDTDQVTFRRQTLSYQKLVYYMLNKPKGVVSATRDNAAPTVVSLLGSDWREDIFPVGRLDKDTTGLLILTNDGELAHRLLSPKKHVDKIYRLRVEHPLTEEDIHRLEEGVDIGEKKPTLPAQVKICGETELLLTIHEGKFHQVKRMLQAVGNHVSELERISIGRLVLDKALKPGEYRELTGQEIGEINEA